MIKEDYLLRMIREIVTMLVQMLLRRKQVKPEEWVEYDSLTRQLLGFETGRLAGMDAGELENMFDGDRERMGKLELAALTMLKMADEAGSGSLVLKSRLRHEGLELLKYVQSQGNEFSIQRMQLIAMLEKNIDNL